MTFYLLYIHTGEIISTKRKKRLEIITSTTGLYLNLLITFLYQANQYVVAPTSGEYAALLGTCQATLSILLMYILIVYTYMYIVYYTPCCLVYTLLVYYSHIG